MKRKLLALFLTIAMIVPILTVQAAAEASALAVGESIVNSLDSITGYENTGAIKSDSGSVAVSGHSILVKPGTSALSSGGQKYHSSRRTLLTPFENGTVLEPGIYRLSVWVYTSNNGTVQTNLASAETHVSEIAVSLHGADESDETLKYLHYDVNSLLSADQIRTTTEVKLFKVNGKDGVPEMLPSQETKLAGTRTWTEYSVTIKTTEALSQFCFWLIAKEGEAETVDLNTYIDDFTVTRLEDEPRGATFRGVQESDPVSGKFAVRFVGTLDSYADYQEIGFTVALSGQTEKPEKDFSCKYVYSKILGSDESGILEAYTAQSLLGTYIFAYSIQDIPIAEEDGAQNYVFTVTPYAIPAGETERISGAAYLVTYTASGELVSISEQSEQ